MSSGNKPNYIEKWGYWIAVVIAFVFGLIAYLNTYNSFISLLVYGCSYFLLALLIFIKTGDLNAK